MRGTIHLVTADDFLGMRPILEPVLTRTFGSTQFAKDSAGIGIEDLLQFARSILEKAPLTRAQLAPLLEERWPGRVGSSLAQAVTYLLPVVQVTPRGLWGKTGTASWTTIEHWLGRELDNSPASDQLVLRYLAAFGPAGVSDARTWSGLPGLHQVFDRLRPRLLTFRSEDGTELFDLPDAPRPSPDAPAPPRLLPEYDNLLLSHRDRSRFFNGDLIPEGWVGNVLVDGLFAGHWALRQEKGEQRLEIAVGDRAKGQSPELILEAHGLLKLAAPEAPVDAVRIVDSVR